ncbi:MAG: META domain-containing protein [Devosia sp.]
MLHELALSIALAMLFATPAAAAQMNLPGQVTYRERIALPEGAMLSIALVDLAIPDTPRLNVAAPIGSGQVPLSFTLTFEDSLILPNHAYALNAEIRAESFLFRNAEPYPVTPLAQIGQVVIVTNPVTETVVSSSEPAQAPVALAILNTAWTATIIGEASVPNGVEISLLIEDDMRAGGVGGCNSYFSQAQIGEDSFMVGNVAKTMRSCLYDRNMLEQSYFDALKAARLWRIDNGVLLLFDSAGKTLVQFES